MDPPAGREVGVPMTIESLYNLFIEQKYIDGLAETSITSYRFQLVGFVRDYGCRESSTLGKSDIDLYISSLRKRKVTQGTLHSYIRSLRIFLKWILNHGYEITFDPEQIAVPRSPKKNPKIYTDDEVELIFDSIKNSIPWLELRDKAIVALMYDSGLRQMEVCNLKLSYLEFSEHRVLVQGKGNKERYASLGEVSETFIRLYMQACPYEVYDNVFYALDGTALTKNAVKLLVFRIKKHLPFELSSHKLRHNFATNYCIDQYERYGTCDSLALQTLMGHSSLQTTEKYLHYASNIMAVKHCRSHLDRLTQKIK